jgi:outer membrane protein assembly factor BamB
MISLLGLVLTSCVPGGSQPAQGWSGITINNGTLYTGSMDGKIMAVNPSARSQDLSFPADGEWEYPITVPSGGGFSCSQASAPVAIYSTPAVDGDLVFIGGYNGKVYALSSLARGQGLDFPQMRNNEWFYPKTNKIIGSIVGSPVIGNNTIYITSSDGKLYSVDKNSGDKNWESDILTDKLWSTPCIDGDDIYVSSFDGHLYALSAKNGEVTWNFTAASKIGFISSPVIHEGVIFAGSFDRNLYAVRVGSNETLWEFTGGNCFWATPLVSNNIIYASCLDGKIYAINASNGTELWSFDVGSPIVVSPLLIEDLLVVVSDSGEVYVLKTGAAVDNDNRKVKNFPIDVSDVSVQASPCAQGDIVYIRGQNNCLYAVDIRQGEVIWKLPLANK